MAHQKKYEYVQGGERTERQWFLAGYLLNEGAKGAERYTNSCHQKTARYYTPEEVHEGGEEWKNIKKQKAHEAYVRRKEQEKLWEERAEYREHMHTEHQWLWEENRIPNPDANWVSGEGMNRFHQTYSYGSRSYYCHEKDTKAPKNDTELIIARWRSDYRYQHENDSSARPESSFSDEEILKRIEDSQRKQ